jgi:hypothetical protein
LPWQALVLLQQKRVFLRLQNLVSGFQANLTLVDIGFFPDGGMSHILSRIGLKGVPEFLALTGHTLRGADIVYYFSQL